MAFLWSRNKQKAPMELAKSAKDLLLKLSTVDKLPEQQETSLAQKISQMKLMLQGTQGTTSTSTTHPLLQIPPSSYTPPVSCPAQSQLHFKQMYQRAQLFNPVLQTSRQVEQYVHYCMMAIPLLKDTYPKTLPSSHKQLISAGEPPFFSETDVSPEQVHQLIHSLIAEDLLLLLAQNIHKLPFEARKDTQFIFSAAFRYKPPGSGAQEPMALHHVLSIRPQIIIALCKGYEKRESAMPCGSVLREALKFDAVAALILYDEADAEGGAVNLAEVDTARPSNGTGVFWSFFDWITKSSFDVCTDAFNTFREILTKHKDLVATFLDTNFDHFFRLYNRHLIMSENYVTKRQSIKLLGELLLDRANYTVMTRYVDSSDHLKITMTLLKDERKMINYESFHVFKVFVANPNKSPAVKKMLQMNRERLLRFLPGFLDDRTDDDQFNDEKSFLVRQIELLPSLAGASGATGSGNGSVSQGIVSPTPSSQPQPHSTPRRDFSGTV